MDTPILRPRFDTLQQKIHTSDTLLRLINSWRLKNNRVAFTNGCFDILHRGHITYLAKASDQAEKLVVALNSDASVKRQGKGENRPINDEQARALVLASLHVVDAVVIFDEDTPLNLIRLLQPDVLLKGGDYHAEETNPVSPGYIVGSAEVRAAGGKVLTIPFVEGYSTTTILQKGK